MVKKKQYWFVSEFYKPVNNATGRIITEIIEEFSKQQTANVLTVGKYDDNDKSICVHRVKDVNANKNKLLSRIKKLTIISLRLGWQMFSKVKSGDTVVVVTNPAPILLFTAFLSKIRSIKIVILVHDVFPENLLVAKLSKEGDLKYKISKKIFDWAYRSADLLITCGRDMEKIIRAKTNNKVPTKTIQNFVTVDNLYHVEKTKNKILLDLGISDKFIVLFTGNIGRMQNVSSLLSAAKILSHDTNIVFLFIGDGAEDTLVEEYIRNSTVKNVYRVGYMPQSEAISFLNAGDIGVASLLPNIMGVGVPSKSYAYLATEIPILAVMDKDSEVALMVQEHNIGWNAPADNPSNLAELILEIKNNPDDLRIKSRNAKHISENEFSKERLKAQFVSAIINV